MKIQIIGYSGSGKSTLAKTLANHYNLPLLYLDAVNFYDNWQERTFEEKNAIVEKFLNDNPDGWVIDGNYSNIGKRRFEESDIKLLKESGAKIVTLGDRILRTETVALNVLSIIMYEFEG